MAVFTPKSWIEDDPITPAELNRIEDGVARVPGSAIYTFRYPVSGDPVNLPAGWLFARLSAGEVRIIHELGTADYDVYGTVIRESLGDAARAWVSFQYGSNATAPFNLPENSFRLYTSYYRQDTQTVGQINTSASIMVVVR